MFTFLKRIGDIAFRSPVAAELRRAFSHAADAGIGFSKCIGMARWSVEANDNVVFLLGRNSRLHIYRSRTRLVPEMLVEGRAEDAHPLFDELYGRATKLRFVMPLTRDALAIAVGYADTTDSWIHVYHGLRPESPEESLVAALERWFREANVWID